MGALMLYSLKKVLDGSTLQKACYIL